MRRRRLSARHRRWALIATAILTACLVSWGVGLSGVNGVKQFHVEAVTDIQPGGVEFRADTPDVRIRPSKDGRVHVSAHGQYSGAKPVATASEDSGSSLVVVDCYAEPSRDCVLSVDVQIPPDAPLRARTSDGPLDVADLRGPLNVNTDSGPVTLTRVSGSVQVNTLSGATHGTGLSGQRFTVSSRSGPVSLGLTAVPASVRIDSGDSQTSLTVPAARYRVLASSGKGSRSIKVDRSASAFAELDLTTSGASIRVRTSNRS